MKLTVANESAMQGFGKVLADVLPARCICYLRGDLGSGKTTLVRAIVKAMGFEGAVKSPTYTLVEPYQVQGRTILHMDLYRLSDPEELEFLGVRDYLSADSLWFVEWPEKGERFLPPSDLVISIGYVGTGRNIEIQANTRIGEQVLQRLRGQNP